MQRSLVALGLIVALAWVGCGESGGEAEGEGPDQYELAREIGYDQCIDPIYPGKAANDPVGYAEEEFGGPGEFDAAREAGCLEALGE